MRRVVQCRSMFALARLPRLARLPASGALLKRGYHWTRAVYAQPGTPKAVPNAQGVLSYTLTDVGEGISECELLQWYVTEGQELNEFDKVCEVQSDKAIVEITSRYTGKVVKLHYKIGDMAKVGGPLIDIKVKPEDGSSHDHAAPSAAAASPASSAAANAVTSSSNSTSVERTLDVNALRNKPLATPAVRAIAKEKNIDLSLIRGTGRDGRVLREDVLNFMASKTTQVKPDAVDAAESAAAPVSAAAPSAPVEISGEDKIVPIRGVRKIMVKTMTAAAAVPHFGFYEEYNVDGLIELRSKLKPIAEANGVKLTFMPMFIKAASLALKKFPELNAHTNSDCSEIVVKAAHNIALAMDTPQGLIVPNIKNVESKSILEIARELQRLQNLGLQGKLAPEDLSGGTFTLSNIGNIGGTYTSPVIFLPQVAIGALGRFQRLPRFASDGQVVAANVVNISWSADHRVVDGATMARFSQVFKQYVQDPMAMLLDTK